MWLLSTALWDGICSTNADYSVPLRLACLGIALLVWMYLISLVILMARNSMHPLPALSHKFRSAAEGEAR